MKDKKENKVSKLKDFLDKQGIFYLEFPNGQLQIDSINIWATTEKYYDSKTNIGGIGINSFMTYLKSREIIK